MANNDEFEPLNYTWYLRIPILLSALKCLSHTDPSDEGSPPVHDEHFFIIVHQAFELWFKQILFEIDSIRNIFGTNDNVNSQLFTIKIRLARTNEIWEILVQQLDLLYSMTPVQFLEFRNYITPASGFQSHQFRLIELKLGLTDRFRESFRERYFTETMFHGEQSRQLVQSIEETSLLTHLERFLEHIYDQMPFNFLNLYRDAVERFIEHGKNEKILNGIDPERAEQEAETDKRQYQNMTNPERYEDLVATNERRITHKAMLASLMITLYHQSPHFEQLYEILRLLMDMDGLINSWRNGHIRLVQRQIGRKPGTGGTAGYGYLLQTLSNQYQVFIDFCNVSSYLIPQRFLPRIDGELNGIRILATQPIQLETPRPVPLVRRRTRSPIFIGERRLMEYSVIGLYLLLFFAGALFSFLFR